MIVCQFESLAHENPYNGFCIVRYSCASKDVPEEYRSNFNTEQVIFSAKGHYLPKNAGSTVKLNGEWLGMNQYGLQFKVSDAYEELPTTEDGILAYLSSGLIKSIGQKRAKLIVDRFGTDTFQVFSKTPEKLLEIRGITENQLNIIIESYREIELLQSSISYLASLRISPSEASRIHRHFGTKTMEILEQRPFELCNLSGFDFAVVDDIAHKAGCKCDDPMRINAALETILDAAASDHGHLFLKGNEILSQAHVLLNSRYEREQVPKNVILDFMKATDNRIVLSNNLAYKAGLYTAEEYAADKLIDLYLCPSDVKAEISGEAIMKTAASFGFEPSEMQIKSVVDAFKHNVTILTGGPGTGKTSVLRLIVSLFQGLYKDKSILMMAPSGRAANRMAESTGYDNAMTIHKALGLTVENTDGGILDLDVDFIIIDETSMLDMWLAYQILKRVNRGTKLLFVGDADQLPSIGPGNFLKELINSKVLPVTTLDYVYRQKDSATIAYNAQKIRLGQTDLDYASPTFQMISCRNENEIEKQVCSLMAEYLKNHDVEQVQVLSPYKKQQYGRTSAQHLNAVLHDLINPVKSGALVMKDGFREFRSGDKIIQTVNTADAANGEIGRIRRIRALGLNQTAAEIVFNNKVLTYDKEQIRNIEHAYAMSIHKSQGSEFDIVIIPLTGYNKFLLRRNLVYTAVTRAKEKVILIGDNGSLLFAVNNHSSNDRNTVLSVRLNQAYDKAIKPVTECALF